jgi:hypothetical protein
MVITALSLTGHSGSFCRRDPKGLDQLRRIVFNIGSTGKSGAQSHNLVHRAMQGLFREAGLTPNFVWDDHFTVPTEFMPIEQQKAAEEAKIENAVGVIKRAQRGARWNTQQSKSTSWKASRCGCRHAPALRMSACSCIADVGMLLHCGCRHAPALFCFL